MKSFEDSSSSGQLNDGTSLDDKLHSMHSKSNRSPRDKRWLQCLAIVELPLRLGLCAGHLTDQGLSKSVARLVRDTISRRSSASVYFLRHVHLRHLQQIDLSNPSIALHWFTQEAWTLGSRYNMRPHSRNILVCKSQKQHLTAFGGESALNDITGRKFHRLALDFDTPV
jgi:hypothetical protein